MTGQTSWELAELKWRVSTGDLLLQFTLGGGVEHVIVNLRMTKAEVDAFAEALAYGQNALRGNGHRPPTS